MSPYKNLSGRSGVLSYDITGDSIVVVFRSGRFRNYLYNNQRPGEQVVNRMKQLAEQGYGLNSYISTTVKTRFARKW
jgi:replicative superfamily II helicase